MARTRTGRQVSHSDTLRQTGSCWTERSTGKRPPSSCACWTTRNSNSPRAASTGSRIIPSIAKLPSYTGLTSRRMPPAIEFRDVEVRIPQGRLLLNHVSLSLDEGTVTAILGRSGSGKTTLLRTVNRMIEPTAGAVLVQGRDVRESDLIALRRGMGYVIQETGLFPHFTVERNAAL